MFDKQPTLRSVSWDDPGETGVGAVLARWIRLDPCPDAVAELAAIDPTSLCYDDRVRLLIGIERQCAWLAALQLPALVAVGDAYAQTVADARDHATDRLSAADAAGASGDATSSAAGATSPAAGERGQRTIPGMVDAIFGHDPDRWAAAEIAPALRISEFTAGQRLTLARTLPIRHPQLDLALRTGRVSYGHVLLVTRETEPLTDQLAQSVDAAVADRYGKATPGELRNAARRATIAADPAGAEERHQAAARRRSLHTRPEPNAMASLHLLAAATEVSQLEAAVADIADRTADAAHHAGRLIGDRDSLLADALIGLARYWLHDTWPVAEPDPRRANPDGLAAQPDGDRRRPVGKDGRRRPGRDQTVVNVVIDLPSLLGLANHPARLDGYGPIPAGLARRLAGDATWRRMVTDPLTHRLLDRAPTSYRPCARLAAYIRDRDLVCDHPGCTKPAPGCQLDHDPPFDLADPDGGRTTTADLYPRCQTHHNGKTHLGWWTGVHPDGTRYTRSPLGFDYDLEPSPYL